MGWNRAGIRFAAICQQIPAFSQRKLLIWPHSRHPIELSSCLDLAIHASQVFDYKSMGPQRSSLTDRLSACVVRPFLLSPLLDRFQIHHVKKPPHAPGSYPYMNAPVDDRHAPVPVKLRNPWLAAFYAWLWPGAGHLYQGRTAKGILFMVCVLSTYFFGFTLGKGHVVYANFNRGDFRYPYLCQVGVGLPALPAIVQNRRYLANKSPLFGSTMMMPPRPVSEGSDQLAEWHDELKGMFEVATLYTMIAGLLNMLAVYDAFAGPVFPQPEEKQQRGPPEDSKSDDPGGK